MDTNRRVAVLAVVVALSLGSPLAAAGWEMPARWASPGDFLKGFTRVLTWLGVKPTLKSAPTCDQGSSIDPNGCPKALVKDHRGSIDHNGALRAVSNAGVTGGRMGIDSNSQH
jgi:hypothetical protein